MSDYEAYIKLYGQELAMCVEFYHIKTGYVFYPRPMIKFLNEKAN